MLSCVWQHKYMQTEWVQGKVLEIGNIRRVCQHRKNPCEYLNTLIEQSGVA